MEAATLLKDIEELGSFGGHNGIPLLNFSELSDGNVEDVLLEAMLNSCDTMEEELLLAVTWGETDILERLLERGDIDSATKAVALEAALTRADAKTLATLIDFGAQPGLINPARLFCRHLNVYQISNEMWTDQKEAGPLVRTPRSPPRSETTANNKNVMSKGNLFRMATMDKLKTALAAGIKAEGMSARDLLANSASSSATKWMRILADVIDGYKFHISARLHICVPGKRIAPTWTDIFLWSVISGRDGEGLPTSVGLQVWGHGRFPLRAALMASQFCRVVAADNLVHQEKLLERAIEYEDWALELLDAIPDSELAQPILLLVPQGQSDRLDETDGRQCMFTLSSLQSALEDDGVLSVPCKRVVAHRHSRHCVDQFFSGNYPGSKVCIPTDTPWLNILLQWFLNWITLFQLPNVFVTIQTPIYANEQVIAKGGQESTAKCAVNEALSNLDGDDGGGDN